MKALLAGRYIVTQDTKNPMKDRRSKDFMFVEVWKAGTRVRVRSMLRGDSREPQGTLLLKGIIEGPGGSQVFFHSDLDQDPVYRQGNTLTENLTPEPERLGYVLQDEGFHESGTFALAALLEQGTVTMEQIREALKKFDGISDEDFDKFMDRHAIS